MPGLPLPIFRTESNLALRNYPDDDALKNPSKYPKALSFTPDIIPLYGASASLSTLVNDASWRGFSGMPVVGGHVNKVHIRGNGIATVPHVATLRAVPSELILWPQVWSNAKPVSSGPVVMQAGLKDKGRYASDGPVQFRPPHAPNQSHSLIAHVYKHDPTKEEETVEKSRTVADFVDFQNKDKEFTFYNVTVADPTLQHLAVSTRLRTFDCNVDVKFQIKAHKGTRDTEKLEASLVDDRGKISIFRTKLSLLKGTFSLSKKYDGMLTLHLFAPSEQALFEPYSGFSLQVLTTDDKLLGSLNIIFEHQSTRNLRFANSCEKEPKGCDCGDGKNGHNHPNPPPPQPCPECPPIPYTKPAATGWWFRTQVNDTNNFPHAGPAGYSPDIQAVGTSPPDATIWNNLLNPGIDYSVPNLVGGVENYVFVRGHSTTADIDVQSRIFALNGNLFLDPSKYEEEGVTGKVWGTKSKDMVAQQSISVANDSQFYLFNTPFTVQAPSDPSNHYCFVAEVRQKPKCRLVYPTWPSEQEENFATLADFTNWILTCPLVCQRNINWVPGNPTSGKCWEWEFKTKLIIPKCGSYCTFWSIIIECESPIIPDDASWWLTCGDNTIFPDSTCIPSCKIPTNSPASAGCHFTGACPEYSTALTLCVKWCEGDGKLPPPCFKLRLAMTDAVSDLSPINHMAVDPPQGNETWPFYVTNSYPYLGDEAHPSPLPSFKASGKGNDWPYPNVQNLVCGQVAFNATKQ